MPTALITGASGFIGRHLTTRLAQEGWNLRCVVRETSRTDHLRELGVELITTSLWDEEALTAALSGCDHLFHVAGLTCAFQPEELYKVNQAGTATLVQAAARQETPPVVTIVSSLAACGPASENSPHTEEMTPAPISNYGRSKRAGEEAAEAMASHVPVTVVRPGIVFGQYNREGLPMFHSIRKMRLHAIPGWGNPPRVSLIHVTDLVELLYRAATVGERIERKPGEEGFTGKGYYFASDPVRPDYRELGQMIATAAEVSWMVPLSVPKPLVWLIAVASESGGKLSGRPSIVNRDKYREAFAGDWVSSGERAQQELDFLPAASLPDRLRETCDWYRDQGWI